MLTSEYNMLRVAGGCSAVKLYNRIRGDRIRGVQKVTLPYLKLSMHHRNYRVLPCLCPRRAPNRLVKHQKPHFSVRKNGGTAEGRLGGRTSLGPSKPLLVLKKQQ